MLCCFGRGLPMGARRAVPDVWSFCSGVIKTGRVRSPSVNQQEHRDDKTKTLPFEYRDKRYLATKHLSTELQKKQQP